MDAGTDQDAHRPLFHVSYTDEGTWRLPKRHGWSWQQPTLRAIERDDDAVEVWKKETWPRVRTSSSGVTVPGLRRHALKSPWTRSRLPPHDDVIDGDVYIRP